MSCHIKYFNIQSFFNSFGYVQNMGIDLKAGTIFNDNLEIEDRSKLEEAIKTAETDSKNKIRL